MTSDPLARESWTMHRFRRLLVGLSRTARDAGLIRYAEMVAQLRTVVEARFVHVLPSPAAALAQERDRVLADVEAEVRTHFTEVPASVRMCCDVCEGPLTDRLLEYATEQEPDLLLLGHRRDHPGRGPLARRLAMKAPCSVWMVPDGSPPVIDRILVPIDFSDHAADTMHVALSLARLCGHQELLALHVYFDEATVSYEGHEVVQRGQEEASYREFLAPIDCQGVQVTPLFVEGANVAHVINRVATKHKADLVMMNTRGRSRSASILLGSVTEATITETHVPLLVVKHFGAQLGLLGVLLDRDFRRKPGPQFD